MSEDNLGGGPTLALVSNDPTEVELAAVGTEVVEEAIRAVYFDSKPYVHIAASFELGDLDIVLNVAEAELLYHKIDSALATANV